MRKRDNKQIILNLIRNNSPIGRAQIAKSTNLTIPSVMKIIDGFMEMGLVREVGKGESTGGKPPVLLELIQDSYFSIGVDLGATNIHCVVMDVNRIVSKVSMPTNFEQGVDMVVGRIAQAITQVLQISGINRERLIGIGIAVPGLLDLQKRNILFSPDIGWQDVDIVTPLAERFHTYVCIDNATRATAFAEKLYGAAKEACDYMCVNLGYGIGGAMVFDHEVYSGFSGSAGEFGHITVIPNGPLCDCGNRGCLEAVSSARALVRDVKKRMIAGEPTALNSVIGTDYNKLEAKLIYDAAKRGDELACSVVIPSIQTLGAAIAGIINLLDFEMIILMGGISRNGTFLTDNLNKAIAEHKIRYAGRHTKVIVSPLGADVTAIGAASIVINQLLESGGNVRLMQSGAGENGGYTEH